MKFIFFLSVLLAGLAGRAENQTPDNHFIYVSGHGSSIGTCNGNQFFCVDQIKDNARRQAEQEARWQCTMQNGFPQFAPSCADFCNPSYLPPDASFQTVSCSSDCQVRCEIRDTPLENQ